MTDIRDLSKIRQANLDEKADAHPKMPGRFVRVDGSLYVPNVLMTNWVQTKDGRVHAAFNPAVQVRENMDVLLVYDERGRLMVHSPDWDSEWVLELNSPLLPIHGSDHTYIPGEPGPDVVDFYARALADCRVYPTSTASMQLEVSAGEYRHGGDLNHYSGGLTIDFTSQIPGAAGTAKIAVICVNGETNKLAYVYGDVYPYDPLIAPPASARPDISAHYVVISAIVLYNGQTEIVEDDFQNEIRPLFMTGVSDRSESAIVDLEMELTTTDIVTRIMPDAITLEVAILEMEMDLALTKHVTGV